MRVKVPIFAVLGVCLALAAPAGAQQTGSIVGKIVDTSGAVLPGVTVEATSNLLPTPRTTVSGGNGEYRLPALPPGTYTVSFTLSGMQTVTRQAQVQLAQELALDTTLGIAALSESVTVTATASLVERESAAIKSGVSNEQIMSLPVGQEYRDLVKLIPGVQYTQDGTRGPSAGGSGQDNVYRFDGANVTLPLFGTLSAEPASHDIAQVTTVKGGARAVDFDRAGGFTIDSVSKSGTNRYSGELSYQLQNNGMAADLKSGSLSRFEQDRGWLTGNVGGPVLPRKLFFYGSYYRPERTRDNRANRYGELPQYSSLRNEGFGKLTFTPTGSVLLNFSYRNSHRLDKSDLFADTASSTTGTGNESWQTIGTAEASWVMSAASHLTFKYTSFGLKTEGRPDNIANATVTTDVGTRLDITNLDKLGLLSVPAPIAGQTAFNAFIQPLVDRYGYNDPTTGARTGSGTVGFATTFDQDDFFRDSGQIGYNLVLGSAVTHELHVGYQRYVDSEDLTRSSNGWGLFTVPGGRLSFQGTPIFYTAAFQQQGQKGVPETIHSEYRSQSIEINDMIRWNNWSFNAGLLASNDTLYGQGLNEDSSTLSGYVLSTATTTKERQYKMYEIPFSKMIQPRLGATWAYNGNDTVFVSYAKYNPAASSLPRAASWDRNLATTIQAHFDEAGVLFATTPVASSSGKLFVEDLTPRTVNEFLAGTARQLTASWSARLYGRYRGGSHFWEDTNNDARIQFRTPLTPDSVPARLYIEDLTARRTQIGSGSTYVIAELDGAYTKYYEGTLESEWRNQNTFIRGSYTWSHYYGNFDQDNSTVGNDANIFIGSSNLADGAGRQLWDMKGGDLRGDRRHMLKLYGYRGLPWNATAGAYAIAQSGQPWEMWSYEPYIALTINTSDTARNAEPTGSRQTASHWQVDLNYTQNIKLGGHLNLQIAGDLFNVLNKQTGYNPQPSFHSTTFGQPRSFYDPRRFQFAARLQF
jgi:carboxypeptidase family protein